MATFAIPVDQRVIDIDSRRFASVEKALVELITNSDDSYARLERHGFPVSGRIRIEYERHREGALLIVTDEAEGMAFERACQILAYGGAHSPLALGEGTGRGYFGRGLKQAVYGLGHGWIETICSGQISRIDLFRSENGGYLYDDGGGPRKAEEEDRVRLGIPENGSRITIVVENSEATISQYHSLVHSLGNNVYLREILGRRLVELVNLRHGAGEALVERVHYEEPPATLLIGPEQESTFNHEGTSYPFTFTLKRSLGTELMPRGDERTNGLVVVSGQAVLDCQFFDYENQIGTEYLFGTVRCPALIEKLGRGVAIISDEREGLNPKDSFVASFSAAVGNLLQPFIAAEQEKLNHLDRATPSNRTAQMIEHLLERMSLAAIEDLGLAPTGTAPDPDASPSEELADALRFSTPFYFRKTGHPFHVSLLLDSRQLGEGEVVDFTYDLSDALSIEPAPARIVIGDLNGNRRLEWTVAGHEEGARGRITARTGSYWAWCEMVVTERASGHTHKPSAHSVRRRPARDHGAVMFLGYDFRNLNNEIDRAVYCPAERKIIINTGAPTVRLYVDGRGHFRDNARLLLAELFMDVISDELARRKVERSGHGDSIEAFQAAKHDIVRRYGSEIHLSFMSH